MGRSREFLGKLTPAVATEILSAVRREMAYSRGEPYASLLFLTYRCTSRCRTCKMWQMQWDLARELTPNEWIRVADILVGEGVRVFELFGGDVLLRKDALLPLVWHLKERNAIVHMPTNSNLLDEETARALAEARVDNVYLSTDGVSTVHDKVRGVKDCFANVQRAVGALVKYRKDPLVPRLVCNTTVSKFNVETLEDIAAFAADAGFDEIDFEYVGEMTPEDVATSQFEGLRPTPYFLRGEESVLASPEQAKLLKHTLLKIKSKYIESRLRIGTENLDCLSEKELVTGLVPRARCYTERCEVTVDPGGNVVACPFFHSLKYGNLMKNSFHKIWWNERHKRFHRHLEENGLPMCRHCIPSVQRSQSFSERLERIYTARMRTAGRKLGMKV